MERLNISGVTLEGFAQGGIRTSIAVPEVGAIFDVGTILPCSLRYDHVFVTHGHPDHIGALQSLVGRRDIQNMSPLNVYVPRPIARPLERIFDLWREVNGGRRAGYKANIVPCDIGDRIQLRKDIVIEAVRTYHTIDSLGWAVEQTTHRLRPEFIGRPGRELGQLKKNGVQITQPNISTILTVPGDTKIDFLMKEPSAQNAKVLLHEVTIWTEEASTIQKTRRFGHTHIDEMVEHCSKFKGEALVLVHRSMKHSRTEIEQIAKEKFPDFMQDKIYFFDGGDRKNIKLPSMPL